jgi:hypothetical protein
VIPYLWLILVAPLRRGHVLVETPLKNGKVLGALMELRIKLFLLGVELVLAVENNLPTSKHVNLTGRSSSLSQAIRRGRSLLLTFSIQIFHLLLQLNFFFDFDDYLASLTVSL